MIFIFVVGRDQILNSERSRDPSSTDYFRNMLMLCKATGRELHSGKSGFTAAQSIFMRLIWQDCGIFSIMYIVILQILSLS